MSLQPLPPITLDPRWFDAMSTRISSRRFDAASLDPALLGGLEETCRRLTDSGVGARALLIPQAPPEVFTGLVGSYGRIAGAPSAVALVGADDAGREVGYVGEAVVLDATAAGADTCWIAGAFDADRTAALFDLAENERVHAIVALGTAVARIGVGERLMRAAVGARNRLSLDELAPGHAAWPTWAQEAVAAIRVAPSGANRQPWRMSVESGSLVLSVAPNAYRTAPIDIGIAMLHAELGASHAGVSGSWTIDAEGARFAPR